jgi:exopolyphosphatase/guanosine-5'-triphosphate,3'-diphosphate pyrophosphatase
VLAAIDVGTNSVRLLLAKVGAGKIVPVRYYRKITRLGGGFTADKGLAPEAEERGPFCRCGK